MDVKGLPPGATMPGIEWLSCHESDPIIAIGTMTAPGSYRLSIRGPTRLVLADRVVLEIVAR